MKLTYRQRTGKLIAFREALARPISRRRRARILLSYLRQQLRLQFWEEFENSILYGEGTIIEPRGIGGPFAQ